MKISIFLVFVGTFLAVHLDQVIAHNYYRGGRGRGRGRQRGGGHGSLWSWWRNRHGGGEQVAISGSTTDVEGPTLFKPECESFTDPDLNLTAFLDCLESNGYYDPPFWFNRNVGATSFFKFVDSPTALGNGSFAGKITGTTPEDQVTLEYFDFNDTVYNQNVGIRFIRYDYYIGDCGVASSAAGCCNLFYLNVYLRSSNESATFYDCLYKFSPNQDANVGEWNTFRVTSCTEPTSVEIGSASSVSECPSTLKNATDSGYVLGTFGEDAFAYLFGDTGNMIFGMHMGNSTTSDEDLQGYFDNVKVKFSGREQEFVAYDMET